MPTRELGHQIVLMGAAVIAVKTQIFTIVMVSSAQIVQMMLKTCAINMIAMETTSVPGMSSTAIAISAVVQQTAQ